MLVSLIYVRAVTVYLYVNVFTLCAHIMFVRIATKYVFSDYKKEIVNSYLLMCTRAVVVCIFSSVCTCAVHLLLIRTGACVVVYLFCERVSVL